MKFLRLLLAAVLMFSSVNGFAGTQTMTYLDGTTATYDMTTGAPMMLQTVDTKNKTKMTYINGMPATQSKINDDGSLTLLTKYNYKDGQMSSIVGRQSGDGAWSTTVFEEGAPIMSVNGDMTGQEATYQAYSAQIKNGTFDWSLAAGMFTTDVTYTAYGDTKAYPVIVDFSQKNEDGTYKTYINKGDGNGNIEVTGVNIKDENMTAKTKAAKAKFDTMSKITSVTINAADMPKNSDGTINRNQLAKNLGFDYSKPEGKIAIDGIVNGVGKTGSVTLNMNADSAAYNAQVAGGDNATANAESRKWGNRMFVSSFTTNNNGIQTQSWKATALSHDYGVAGGIDPIVKGELQGVTMIDGKYYAVVQADSVDLFDGNGAQDANGELIYIEISEEDATNLSGQEGENVVFAGDVTTSVDGHLTMVMNEGGYAVGDENVAEWDTTHGAGSSWYQSKTSEMSTVWVNINAQNGPANDWQQGWNFLEAYATK